MMNHLKKLEDQASTWAHVSVHPRRYGGREFRFESAEVGHTHEGGIVDIPFTRSIRDVLLAQGLADEHHHVPNSGWITFHVGNDEDLNHALWLMRLSYLRYALKRADDPRKLLVQECDELRLSPQFRSLLGEFLPFAARQNAMKIPV